MSFIAGISMTMEVSTDLTALPLGAPHLEGDGVVSTDGAATGLSRQSETVEQRSLLSSFAAFVVRLAKPVMAWVAGLVEGLSVRLDRQRPGRSLSSLADGAPLTPRLLEELVAEGGELRKLKWIGLYGSDEFVKPMRELLGTEIAGIAAGEWALGGRSAARLVKHCGERTQIYLGNALAQWSASAQSLFEVCVSASPATTSELSSLLEGLQQVQESELDWDFKAEAFRLAETFISDIPVKAWAIDEGAAWPWLASAGVAYQGDTARDLRLWRDDVVALLDQAWERVESSFQHNPAVLV